MGRQVTRRLEPQRTQVALRGKCDPRYVFSQDLSDVQYLVLSLVSVCGQVIVAESLVDEDLGTEVATVVLISVGQVAVHVHLLHHIH